MFLRKCYPSFVGAEPNGTVAMIDAAQHAFVVVFELTLFSVGIE